MASMQRLASPAFALMFGCCIVDVYISNKIKLNGGNLETNFLLNSLCYSCVCISAQRQKQEPPITDKQMLLKLKNSLLMSPACF